MKKAIKLPIYRRQRLLLYFLECLSTEQEDEQMGISKMDLQKLLLLYSKENRSTHYDFVPWERGGYSLQCEADLSFLEKRGWIEMQDDEVFLKKTISIEHSFLSSKECETVREWICHYPIRGKELVRETYKRYPYYAFHSKIKADLLNAEELEKVESSVGQAESDKIIVFTLGYEGINLETYLNRLISKHVFAMCDVRRNAMSRKFGFSASILSSVLPKLNIEYNHFPALGIESEKRRNLDTKGDYKVLFQNYCEKMMDKQEELESLKRVIESQRRVVLTCFEENPEYCHRHCISDFLESEYHYQVEHL